MLARKQFTCVDGAGNVLPGASVEVRREEVGQPLALLYADRDGEDPIGNPFQADADGFAAFHTAGGAYQIKVTSGTFIRTHRYEAIGRASEFDPDEFGRLTPVLQWRALVDISNLDLDDIHVSGFYWGEILDNAPGASSDPFYVQALALGEEEVVQIAWRSDDPPVMALRIKIADVWGDWVPVGGGGGVQLDETNAWTRQQYFPLAELTDAGTIAWNLDENQVAAVTLGGNRNMGDPTGGQEGAVYILIVRQPATTATRTLGYHANFVWPDGDAPVIATGANVRSILTFVRENGKMRGVSALNYAA